LIELEHVRVFHDHTSLVKVFDFDCFIFDLVIFKPIDNDDGVFMILG